MSIGTIYNYYANLDELFFDVFVEGTEQITELLEIEKRRKSAVVLLLVFVRFTLAISMRT